MNTPLPIARYRNLANRFGSGFLDFEIKSPRGFNQRVSQIVLESILDQLVPKSSQKAAKQCKPSASNNLKYKEIFETARMRAKALNFLRMNFSELTTLASTIERCLNIYITVFSKDYHGHYPRFFHSWPVCGTRIYSGNFYAQKEIKKPNRSPEKELNKYFSHMHHQNPLNIAGVYYASGDFKKDNGSLYVLPSHTSKPRVVTYVPRPGKLILFPADLLHGIHDYSGQTPRVSIAFDIWFRPDPSRNFQEFRCIF